ncbi:MAG: helix-turn-helix domain-containing protein [Planctomycetota bacterium]
MDSKNPRIGVLLETDTAWARYLIEGIINYSKSHCPWDLYLDPLPIDKSWHLPGDWKGDGIIARVSAPYVLRQLRSLGLPVVNVSGNQVEGCDYPRVMTSVKSQAELAYDAFRSRGFEQFAYVGPVEHAHVLQHCDAYRQCLERYGYQLRIHQPQSFEALKHWLRSVPKPIAVFCWGSHWGGRIINACSTDKISVPHDIAVLGSNYDEIYNEASFPAQAGIEMNPRHIGELASSVLDRLMKGQTLEQNEWLLEPIKVVEKPSIDTFAVADERVRQAIDFLNRNALNAISVDDVVKVVPIPRRTLERRFRKCTGHSIRDYTRQLRVNHARELLANTDQTMVAISDECGFSSYNYFNRVFKQLVGVSPSRYRREWKESGER